MTAQQGHGGEPGDGFGIGDGSQFGSAPPAFANPSETVPLFHAIPGIPDRMVRQIMAQSRVYAEQTRQLTAPALATLDQLEVPVHKILAAAHNLAATTRDLIGVAKATLSHDARGSTNLLEALMKLPAPMSNGEQSVRDIVAHVTGAFHS